MKKLTENSTFKNLRTWNPVQSWYGKQERKKWKQRQMSCSWAPKPLWTVTEAMKLEDTCPLEGELRQASLCAEVAQLCSTPRGCSPQAPLSTEFFRQESGMGCHLLLQGISPSQGWDTGLQHCRQTLYLPFEPPETSLCQKVHIVKAMVFPVVIVQM